MVDLAQCLRDLSATKAREVLYFLSRYFKGSPYLEENGKDIFADVFDDDHPEDDIRERTLKVIDLIEADIGKRASEFDEDTAASVLEQITALEDSLDEAPSTNDV